MTTNTKTIAQLEEAFNSVAKEFGASVLRGIQDGRADHEDGFPWFEIYGGSVNRHSADEVCQRLADVMNCDVFLNSTDSESIEGTMDFDEDRVLADGTVPAFEPDDECHPSLYGEAFRPKAAPAPKI